MPGLSQMAHTPTFQPHLFYCPPRDSPDTMRLGDRPIRGHKDSREIMGSAQPQALTIEVRLWESARPRPPR